MKKQNLIASALLILGLLFSATLGFKFNLSNGFEYKGLWFFVPVQFFDLAVKSSNETFLTSHLIGYLFYILFAIYCFKQFDLSLKAIRMILIVFCILTGMVLLSDFYSFYQDLNNQFTGRHFRIGLTVFTIGLILIFRLNAPKESMEVKA